MPLSVVTEGLYLHRKAADPLKQVQIVRTLVQKHASALSCPGCPPSARIVIGLSAVPVRDDPVHPFDLSVFAAVDDFIHFPVNAVGALIEHHGEHLIRFFRRLVHLADLLCIDSGGLFAQSVQAVPQGGDHQPGVIVMRRGDQHRVTDAGFDQSVSILKNDHILRKVFLRPLSPRLPKIRHRGELQLRHLSVQDRPAVAASHISDSNDSKLYLFHVIFPFHS